MLHLYTGNGEGSISNKAGFTTFTAAPSGGGGDVQATFTIESSVLCSEFNKALLYAQKEGFRFQ
jgi:hypothetical protein